MNIIIVDPNKNSLELLFRCVKKAMHGENIHRFSKGEEAVIFTRSNPVDIAFLETDLSGYPGVTLAENLMQINRDINIIIVTYADNYLSDAFGIHVSGFVQKPINEQKVKSNLANLRYKQNFDNKKYLKIKTFGGFEVSYDNKSVKFARSKSKELLAYLISKKGTSCTINELVVYLLEDNSTLENSSVYIRKIISELIKSLRNVGLDNIIDKSYNSVAIREEAVDCDFYRAITGSSEELNSFNSDFLPEYAWAESINSFLELKKYNQ